MPGAEIINDISSLGGDEKMASVVKKASAALILMHMKGKLKICKLEI